MNTPKDPSPAMSEIKAPDGAKYITLDRGATIQKGDEFFDDGEWHQTTRDGGKVANRDFVYRRPLPASAPAGSEGTPITDEAVFKDSWGCEVTMAEIPRDLERKLQAYDAKAARLEKEVKMREAQVLDLLDSKRCDEAAHKRTVDALQAALATAQQSEARLRTALERVCITISKCRGVPPVLKAAVELAKKALSAQPEAGAKS